MKRRKYLKVAVTPDEYSALSICADQEGLTLAAYVRAKLAGERQAVEVEEVLARIESKLAMEVVDTATAAPSILEPLLVENLLLTREIASERNAQLLARVAQKLNNKIEGFYNRRRRHSTLGYVSPAEYYAGWLAQQKLAA